MSSEQKFPAIRGDRVRRQTAPAEKRGAVIYCRVSSKDQLDGFSIETQERLCRTYCVKLGYTVTQVYHEAKSAKGIADRPEFQKMLQNCVSPRK
jgi:DNA invertase Pin-like site-specific DNA recombinase